ncbi:restriction endonuclease subunit S [Vibrio vulnificus]|uniref:restriction endonuclease subunit S n=1 Tax=Vibrio vulnificus TaxID=672 RepID=UPI001CDCAC42|nr:restriction endonuclease subunit S [Vibrio vulnificus]MDS1803030.1 restriction endonuclease subunit S [Vibrio vulnificus]
MISPEFKRFPNEWKVLPFLEVFEDVTSKGKKVKKENYQITGDIPVVDQGQKFFGGYTDEANKITGVDLPAIVFGDHTKAFKYVEVDFAIGADGVKLLNPKIDADKKFLFYYLKQLKLEDAGYSRHFKFLKETYIPLPPLETQKKIAAVLERADQLRKDCQQMEQELNSLAQSVFIDMFGDPVTNPKGWDVATLGDEIEYIGDIGSNGSNDNVSQNLDMKDEEDYAVMIRTTNLNANDFTNNLKYISERAYNYFSKSKIYGGEIIMNKIGSAGKFWIMPDLQRPVSLGLNQLMIRLKNANTWFIYYYLSTSYGQQLISSKTRGAITKSITKSAVKDIPIIVPPMEKQAEFSLLIEKNNKLLAEQALLRGHYEQSFNALMQKAFKGELNL